MHDLRQKARQSRLVEVAYEDDNRDYVSAQLRDAADHLKFSHRETALRLRDLAVVIEEVRDKEFGSIAQELEKLRNETRELFYKDYPEARRRLEELHD